VGLTIDIRNSLGSLADEWDLLAAIQQPVAPMSSSVWVDCDDPTFVLAMDGDELVGGIPLRVRRRFGLEFARLQGGNCADLLTKPGREAEVTQAIRGWLASAPRFLHFRPVLEHPRLLASLPGWHQTTPVEVSRWTRLPATFEEYLKARPSELRNTVRKTNRRLERAGVQFVITQPRDVPLALDEQNRLWAMRWGFDAPLPRSKNAPDVIQKTEAVARGQFALYQLVVDGFAIAIHSCYQLGNAFQFTVLSRDPTRHEWRGSGTMLLAHSINQACEMGFDELDFGTGNHQYKDLWTDEVRILCEIRSAVPGFASRAMVQTESLARRVRQLSKPRTDSEGPRAPATA
jgi:CelD/BcsL family acetyltransferase involved in cellulose biosynthesis